MFRHVWMGIRRKWYQLQFINKFSLVVFAVIFAPLSFLSLYIALNSRNSLIESRRIEVEILSQTRINQVEKTSDLINLSTQVVMNSSTLIEYLEALDKQEKVALEDVLSIQERDIKLLEKIVISNPYLYQLRVFSTNNDIVEIMPILYGSKRSKYEFGENYQSEWFYNTDDQIYQYTRVVPHILSLVSNINNPWGKQIGLTEISVRMDELFPSLFMDSNNSLDYFIDKNGKLHGIETDDWINNLSFIDSLTLEEKSSIHITNDYIVSIDWYPELKSHYIQLSSLDRINTQIISNTISNIIILVFIFAFVVIIVRRVFKNIFSEVNDLFDTVSEFSMGDLEVRVPIKSNNEIGVVSEKINNVFDQMIELIDENIEREVVSKNAQIKALQSQINAHFIYNVLESIKMMAEIKEHYDIADSVNALGSMLHYSMHWNSQSKSLREEIEYTKHYLSLMNLRLDYDIILRIDIPESLMEMSIPKVALQPIIENTVLHGYEYNMNENQYIDVSVDVEKNIISVKDYGLGLDEQQLKTTQARLNNLNLSDGSLRGIGLKNVHQRIKMMFGDEYGIEIKSKKHMYTEVLMHIPLKGVLKK